MIKIRLDVDYPYPSRLQSFLFTILNIKIRSNYLKNSKIIAKMINQSPKEIRAYWFFTPQTTPDEEMLQIMHQCPDRHEAALHIATNPYKELERLEQITNQKLRYYTIHGTARLFARLIWRRNINQPRVSIPYGFPLKNFWDFPTLGLDRVCYSNPITKATKIAEQSIVNGEVLHVHPEWLFQRGTFNHRGPYYEVLRTILSVNGEFEGLTIRRKGFLKIASFAGPGVYSTLEYERDFVPTDKFLTKLTDMGADVFTFLERKWSYSLSDPPKNWTKVKDDVALLRVTSYSEWWEGIGKKTRNMVRKAEKNGVITRVVEPSDHLAEGIWRIYNETPIRQGRAFPYFGISLKHVYAGVRFARNTTFVGAYLGNDLVGFIQLVRGDKISIISQILSSQKFWDKAVNNALVAKAIEASSEEGVPSVMYGRSGNHPSLDAFKESNGFTRFPITRFFVPLTVKGRIAVSLGLQREMKDALPQSVKRVLLPAYVWVSVTKTRMRHKKSESSK